MAEMIKKWAVVDKLTSLENEFQRYKPFEGSEHAMYRKLCEVEMEIGKMSAVDAVPVVRCCNCQYCDVFQNAPDSEPILMCMIHSFELVDFTDYCSRGERKDNG